MKWEQQKTEFDAMIEELRTLLWDKGLEYAGPEDCLGNLKRASEIGVTPEQKLWIFLDKHLSSIKSYIREGKTFSNETIDGRICDAINYLFLLRCLIRDKEQAEAEKLRVEHGVYS